MIVLKASVVDSEGRSLRRGWYRAKNSSLPHTAPRQPLWQGWCSKLGTSQGLPVLGTLVGNVKSVFLPPGPWFAHL